MGTEWDRWHPLNRPFDTYFDRTTLSSPTPEEEAQEEEERRRLDKFRRDLEAFERWNMLPEWKRVWFGEKTREDLKRLDQLIDLAEDIPDIRKSIRLAKGAETASGLWKKGIMAFFGGILILGPGLKMLKEMWDWFMALRVGPH